MIVSLLVHGIARGKLAGQVGTYWRGHNILRAKASPAQPNTPAQLAQRNVLQTVMNEVQVGLSDPDTYEAWKTWTEANPWPKKYGGTQVLPPYQSAVKVMMARKGMEVYTEVDEMPISTPLGMDESVVVTATDNEAKIAWGTDAFKTGEQFVIYGTQCGSAVQHPVPAKGRVLYVTTPGALSHAASTFFTWSGGAAGDSANWCFWGRRMDLYDKYPSPYKFFANLVLTVPV